MSPSGFWEKTQIPEATIHRTLWAFSPPPASLNGTSCLPPPIPTPTPSISRRELPWPLLSLLASITSGYTPITCSCDQSPWGLALSCSILCPQHQHSTSLDSLNVCSRKESGWGAVSAGAIFALFYSGFSLRGSGAYGKGARATARSSVAWTHIEDPFLRLAHRQPWEAWESCPFKIEKSQNTGSWWHGYSGEGWEERVTGGERRERGVRGGKRARSTPLLLFLNCRGNML